MALVSSGDYSATNDTVNSFTSNLQCNWLLEAITG